MSLVVVFFDVESQYALSSDRSRSSGNNNNNDDDDDFDQDKRVPLLQTFDDNPESHLLGREKEDFEQDSLVDDTEEEEEEEDTTFANQIGAVKQIAMHTPYRIHLASQTKVLTLHEHEDGNHGVILEDEYSSVDPKQAWFFDVDGSIVSDARQDLVLAVQNGQVAVAQKNTEESSHFSKKWRVVFIDPSEATRHKYIVPDKNNKLVLDLGRKGLSLRVNKLSMDESQKWLLVPVQI